MPTKTEQLRESWSPLCGRLDQPLRWRKSKMIVTNSTFDLFHETVADESIINVFMVMAAAQEHTFQILTKRPERMRTFMRNITEKPISKDLFEAACSRARWFDDADAMHDFIVHQIELGFPNVWLGVSVENQATVDERIPVLLETPAAVRWISAEPLVGSIDILPYVGAQTIKCGCGFNRDERFIFGAIKQGCLICKKVVTTHPSLDWVVVGGESGQNARPMHPDWAYSLQDQCKSTETPFFFKQWGEWASPGGEGFGTHTGKVAWINSSGEFLDPPPQDENADCLTIKHVGIKAAGRLLRGRFNEEFPISNKEKQS